MKDEPRKTNTALWSATGTVMVEGIALGSPVLGAGLTQFLLPFPYRYLMGASFIVRSILMIISVFILGRASTFLYPREQGSEKWEFL